LTFFNNYTYAKNITNALGAAPSSSIPIGRQADNGDNVENYYSDIGRFGNCGVGILEGPGTVTFLYVRGCIARFVRGRGPLGVLKRSAVSFRLSFLPFKVGVKLVFGKALAALQFVNARADFFFNRLAVCHQPFILFVQHVKRLVYHVIRALICAGPQCLRDVVFLLARNGTIQNWSGGSRTSNSPWSGSSGRGGLLRLVSETPPVLARRECPLQCPGPFFALRLGSPLPYPASPPIRPRLVVLSSSSKSGSIASELSRALIHALANFQISRQAER
jgi:hypothetical protein